MKNENSKKGATTELSLSEVSEKVKVTLTVRRGKEDPVELEFVVDEPRNSLVGIALAESLAGGWITSVHDWARGGDLPDIGR